MFSALDILSNLKGFLIELEKIGRPNDLAGAFDLFEAPPADSGDAFVGIAVGSFRDAIAPGDKIFRMHMHFFTAEHQRFFDDANARADFADADAGLFEHFANDGLFIGLALLDPSAWRD